MTTRKHVYLTTATGGLSTHEAPVGGGVAVAEGLLPHLCDAFEVTWLRPGSTAKCVQADGAHRTDLAVPCLAGLPREALLSMDEQAYARFSLEWEAVLGDFFLDVNPKGAVVIANDVSEGPPFAEIARRGFRQLVLYHVVVGDFFARQYLRLPLGAQVPSPWAAAGWRAGRKTGVHKVLPRLLQLVWEKEEQAARWAEAVCPSMQLAESLAALYPESGISERTSVIPWGVIGEPDPRRRRNRAATLEALEVDPQRFVLLTLSRISREKRIHLLFRALRRIERESPQTAARMALVVAGAPAYMGGEKTWEQLERAAATLHHVQVRFAGYASGDRKWNLFAAADLFCSTSRYEAYGLTIAQALASGTPTLATDHQGAQAILDPRMGWVVPAKSAALAQGIREALGVPLEELRRNAAEWGRENPFGRAAEAIVEIVGG